ncbi:MAG: alkaline phosphatase family protein [Candidatus Eisenbacteria bacterium]|nr:alkaline phosphatase family protein [Candidatus Eisenbacteria bacterium]
MALAFWKKKRSGPKACVFGIDGLPQTLLARLMDGDVMPRAKEIFGDGNLRKMRVTLPEVSAVSWPSFMAGADPGTHGIYGFTEFEPGGYGVRFPSFPSMKTSTLWDRLGEKGLRSVVVNQPSTYPAREIPGVLIAGFVAIDMRKAVYPAFLAKKLEQLDYEIDVDSQRGGKDPDFLFRELTSTLRGRERVLDYLWDREEWDLFEIVVTGTDRLQHFQYAAVEDPGHPHHGRAMEYYGKVDAFLGKVFDRYAETTGGPEGFIALSDHGFTLIRREFYLNAWLAREGYLSFAKERPESFADAAPSSRAFGLDPTRIYLHRKDRFPKGCVDPAEIPAICEEIRSKAMALEFEGEKVFQGAFRPEEIYSGPQTAHAPDLVLLANDGYDVKGWMRTGDVFGRSHFTGMHNWDDAFLWTTETMPEGFDITSVAGVIERRLTGGGD